MDRKPRWTSAADYLAMEERSESMHEYVDGEIYAMPAPTIRHHLLLGNLFVRAYEGATGHCEVLTYGMTLCVSARNSYYYPDLMGCCDLADDNDRYVTAPCFIAEVLSPETARIDRHEKWWAYQTLQTLHEYVLIEQECMQVTVHRREESSWSSQILSEPDHVFGITCLGVQLPLKDLYERVSSPRRRSACRRRTDHPARSEW